MIVAASGYFNIIHRGHIEYLKQARSLGDRLIVIINNDDQARLKYGDRFVPFEDRSAVISELMCVDAVFESIDMDGSVCSSLSAIRPNIFAKGGDRTSSEIPEAILCDKLGIKIIDNLGEKVQSSSSLMKKLSK